MGHGEGEGEQGSSQELWGMAQATRGMFPCMAVGTSTFPHGPALQGTVALGAVSYSFSRELGANWALLHGKHSMGRGREHGPEGSWAGKAHSAVLFHWAPFIRRCLCPSRRRWCFITTATIASLWAVFGSGCSGRGTSPAGMVPSSCGTCR